MIFAALIALSFQSEWSPASVQLGEIEARLFYAETGRLSKDMLAIENRFVAHNTIIGEGSAEESADDILVIVNLRSKEGQVAVEAPVEIEVRDRAGKIVAKRSYTSILTSEAGIEKKALWVPDSTCSGELNITTRYNGEVRKAQLIMGCGE